MGDGDGDAMDRVVIERAIECLNGVSEARSMRQTATHNENRWIVYAFLLEMGVMTIFGMMLLQVGGWVGG